jgi:hypothetical protein
MRYYIGILFSCFILVSCSRYADEVIIVSKDVEIKKQITENIFYGINSDPIFYIINKEYIVKEYFQEAIPIPAFGIYQSFYSLTARNDALTISFKNNVLETVDIYNNTNEHPLGEYIGRNINEVKNILGEEDRIRNINDSYSEHLYFVINDNNDYIRIVTYDVNDENIISIQIGVDNNFRFINDIWNLESISD